MFAVLKNLFVSAFEPDTPREKALSDQVDRLEFELAKARREQEAARIRMERLQAEFNQHRLRDYPIKPAAEQLHNQDLFTHQFKNPIDQLLADVAALGYDVSGPAQTHHATLALIAQYQQGVAQVLASAHSMRQNQYVLHSGKAFTIKKHSVSH